MKTNKKSAKKIDKPKLFGGKIKKMLNLEQEPPTDIRPVPQENLKISLGPGIDKTLEREIIKAIKQQAADEIYSKSLLNRDMGVLESVVSEYLKSFMVIGYDINGDKISITHAANSQDFDSIVEHARGTLMGVIFRAQQNLPGMGN